MFYKDILIFLVLPALSIYFIFPYFRVSAISFPDFFFETRFLVNITILNTVGLYIFVSFFKAKIIDSVSPQYNKKLLPSSIHFDSPSKNSSTLEYSLAVYKLNGVAKDPLSLNGVVFSKALIKEYSFLQRPFLNVGKGRRVYNLLSDSKHQGFIKKAEFQKLGKIFCTTYLENIIGYEVEDINYLIRKYVNTHGQSVHGETLKIDIQELLVYVLSENAYKRLFGNELVESPKFRKTVDMAVKSPFAGSFSKIKFIRYLQVRKRNRIISSKIAELSEYIYNRKLNPNIKIENKNDKPTVDALDMAFREHNYSKMNEYLILIKAIINTLFYYPAILSSRLANIIVDISVRPAVLMLLIDEQKNIRSKHGEAITLDILNKMERLEYFIFKSLSNSLPFSFMHRSIEDDYFTSSGYYIPKGSSVSLDMFSFYRNYRKKNQYDRLSAKNVYLLKNPIGNVPVHPGYRFIHDVLPKSTTLYLKKHDINLYREFE
ncbi:hypothetical protein BB560_000616 [Smittium megazygosporum]|uniref:Cytochrome P450 n=1 Tax=Smittium megazygosporum TaxID=133381 RepID=A0A2T9ZJZ5_9FUNG|nr:hypothetical protein BB560_000616 [Smittium megazygosporum]